MTDERARADDEAVLEPGEAAIRVGITEDDVLIRRRRGELPAVLRFAELSPTTCADELRARVITVRRTALERP